jgi:uncharacterized membrane protein YbaN (DUF454 family)
MNRARIRKWFLITVGIVSLGLGLVGAFVPVLPTTPFLLLAAGCFMRSSQRLYDWLTHHKWFGEYLRNYREYRAISLRAKVVTLVLLWGVIGPTALFTVTLWWVRVLLGVVAVGVTLHLLHLETLTPETTESNRRILEGGN